MRIMWTPAAAGDLEQITDYLYEQAPEIADDLVQRIYSAPSVLKQFPNTGRPGRKIRDAGIGNYFAPLSDHLFGLGANHSNSQGIARRKTLAAVIF